MKRFFILILCLCIAVAGCSLGPVADTQLPTQPDAATQATDPIETIPPMVYQKPLTAVSTIPHQKSVRGEDGALLYSSSSQALTLSMNDHEIAQIIVSHFSDWNQQRLSGAETDLALAQEDYFGQEDWIPYFCDIRYSTARLDPIVLSLVGNEKFYDGTHRSGESLFTLNYDMQSGISMTLQDVMTPDFSADELTGCILDALAAQAEFLYEDYGSSITAMFSSNAPVENWYLTENGLCFYFNPYEIAPQSEGIILAEIPYTELAGLLKDAFFPSEAVEFTGSLTMAEFEAAPEDMISRYVEAILDSNGNYYLIYPQGTVRNLRVETGTWAKDGSFSPDYTLCFAEALTEGTAFMLQLRPEDLGKLCVTYQSGSQIIQTPWQPNHVPDLVG